jgi:hypothetical protein
MRSETPKILPLRSADTLGREVRKQDVIATPERDNFVASTAVKIDQLEAGSRTLARGLAEISSKVDAMQEIAGHDHRLHAFDQQERRARDGKLEDVIRSYRDLKARLDRIEARSGGDYHTYNSFEAVSRKLAELESQKKVGPRLGALLFCGSLAIGAAIGLGIQLVGGPL